MELSGEQIEEFKKQIVQQIESSFSEDKKGPAIERVKTMNDEEFIEFLKKNKLLGSESGEDSSEEQSIGNANESPFRLIVEGKIPAYVIDENKDCIAVLEINPVSKGHIIIIPKRIVSPPLSIPKSVFTLAKKISKNIEKNFKPKEVLISSSQALGEIIINILPVYTNESLSSPRKQVSKEELEALKNILEKKKKAKQARKPRVKKIEESKIWFPKRIP